MTAFLSYAFATADGPTSRTLPDRLAEIVNVKDWGAVGDDATDDTAALQAAINEAYPGLGNQVNSCRPLFFPNGIYRITQPLYLPNTLGGWLHGAGKRATQIKNVSTGAGEPDTGSTTLSVNAGTLQFTRGSGSFVDDGFEANQHIISSGFSDSRNNAEFIISSVTAGAITVKNNTGYHAAGAMQTETGNGNERITTIGWGSVFQTGYWSNACVENMTLIAASKTNYVTTRNICFDWAIVGSTGCTFINVRLQGGDVGARMNYQASEGPFFGCDFINNYRGAMTVGQNAINYPIIGGRITGNDRGLYGSDVINFAYCSGVLFSGNGIDNESDIPLPCVMQGCESTSTHFLTSQNGIWKTIACWHHPAASGGYTFSATTNRFILDGCLVEGSVVAKFSGANSPKFYLRGSSVPGTFISGSAPTVPTTPENI